MLRRSEVIQPANTTGLRVLVVASFGNPLGTNWVKGLRRIGCRVVAIDHRHGPCLEADLHRWGLEDEVVISWTGGHLTEEQRSRIERALGGTPDLLFGWWGSLVLPALQDVAVEYPSARKVLCVDTLPNASNFITEYREVLRFLMADRWLDGYVFYSQSMAQLFYRRVPGARQKPHLALIEPFLLDAFAPSQMSNVPILNRTVTEPHVVFTGRGDLLWTRDYRMKKDAIGPFLVEVANHGVQVYVEPRADLRNHPNLHHYPDFSNQDLFGGRFADYVSQFDAHLVIYNECNPTIRRRVTTGLCTRMAFAMTATAPLAVSSTSTFVAEYWKDEPFGFMFTSATDLVAQLMDTERLVCMKNVMARQHRSFALETLAPSVLHFLQQVRCGERVTGA